MSWTPEVGRVIRTRSEQADVTTIEVEPSSPTALPRTQPGQFFMLYALGVGEIPVSVSGIGPLSLRFTIRNVGAVSAALGRLRPGARLGLRGPFGRGWPLDHPADDLLIMAGGLGLAPLKPVLDAALQKPGRWKAVHLLQGARDPDHILFSHEAQIWREAGCDVRVTVDSARTNWDGPVGVVTQLIEPVRWNPQASLALICGPEIMMRFSADRLISCGLRADCIYLSMERNMKCALGYCGHCQWGAQFVCRDGPVFPYEQIARQLRIKEL